MLGVPKAVPVVPGRPYGARDRPITLHHVPSPHIMLLNGLSAGSLMRKVARRLHGIGAGGGRAGLGARAETVPPDPSPDLGSNLESKF